MELDSRWGAWETPLAVVAVFGMMAGLMIIWAMLATIYCLPVRLITLYENRDLNWRQSWRLAGAALMPGALFLTFVLLFYGFSSLSLPELGLAWLLHLVIGWIYLLISPFFLLRDPSAEGMRGNPFAPGREGKEMTGLCWQQGLRNRNADCTAGVFGLILPMTFSRWARVRRRHFAWDRAVRVHAGTGAPGPTRKLSRIF